MDRKLYIQEVIGHMKGEFIRALEAREPEAINDLKRCFCQVEEDSNSFKVKFRLASFFDALCLNAQRIGIERQGQLDWGKEFKEFCRQLFESWPMEEYRSHGFDIKLVHRSNSNAKTEYAIIST